MWQPDGGRADVPEIKISGGIQYAGLQTDGAGGQDAVNPEAGLFWQSHVNNDRHNAEQKRGGQAGCDVSESR